MHSFLTSNNAHNNSQGSYYAQSLKNQDSNKSQTAVRFSVLNEIIFFVLYWNNLNCFKLFCIFVDIYFRHFTVKSYQCLEFRNFCDFLILHIFNRRNHHAIPGFFYIWMLHVVDKFLLMNLLAYTESPTLFTSNTHMHHSFSKFFMCQVKKMEIITF